MGSVVCTVGTNVQHFVLFANFLFCIRLDYCSDLHNLQGFKNIAGCVVLLLTLV